MSRHASDSTSSCSDLRHGPANVAGARDGFTTRLRDERIERLIGDELARRFGPAPRKSKKRPPADERPYRRRVKREKRTPLITQADVDRAFEEALGRRALTRSDTNGWPTTLLQIRISLNRDKLSTSPARQLDDLVEWCVRHERVPLYLLSEVVSGSLFRRGPRHDFDHLFDDIEHDRIRDPRTGERVQSITTFMLDRFTREPDVGEQWLKLLRRKGMDLHESFYDQPPRPLHQVEHEIRAAWANAAKEVIRFHERVMAALKEKAERGEPTYGGDHYFGHARIDGPRRGRRRGVCAGYATVPDEAAVIQRDGQRILDGAPLYSITCEWNDAGYRNSEGGLWTMTQVERVFRSPRLFGGVWLRTDRTKLHQDDYAGELYPKELLVPAGEPPLNGFVPPIEPIIPYAKWLEIRLELDSRAVSHGPHRKYLMSRVFICGACGDRMIGGMRNGQRAYRCAKRHLLNRSRSSARGTKVAHDGLRHPTVAAHIADALFEELVFAAVEFRADVWTPPELDEETARARLNARLDDVTARFENVIYMHQRGDISRERYDEFAAEIDAEKEEARAEYRRVRESLAPIEIPEGTTLCPRSRQTPQVCSSEFPRCGLRVSPSCFVAEP